MTKEVLCIIYPFSVRTANIQALKYFMILFNCNKKYCTVSWLLLQNKPRQGDQILYHPEGTYTFYDNDHLTVHYLTYFYILNK